LKIVISLYKFFQYKKFSSLFLFSHNDTITDFRTSQPLLKQFYVNFIKRKTAKNCKFATAAIKRQTTQNPRDSIGLWNSHRRSRRNEYRIALTRLMREERYQGQHGAQPPSSMILHAGCFHERYRTTTLFSLFSDDGNDNDNKTDLVVSHSLPLLTVIHCSIPALNNIHGPYTHHLILSQPIARATHPSPRWYITRRPR